MFTDCQLGMLSDLLTRRLDNSISEKDYGELLRVVEGQKLLRASTKRRQEEWRARRDSIEPPILIDPFNDPSKW